jgi:hypothetical protein
VAALDQLPPEVILILRQCGLPHDRPIRDRDLVRVGLVAKNDRHSVKRLTGIGFPYGHYIRPNMKVYWPLDVGRYLLAAPEAHGRASMPKLPPHLKVIQPADRKPSKNKTRSTSKRKRAGAADNITKTA